MPTLDVKQYMNAWNAHALDRILECYTDDAEVVDAGSGTTMHGKEEIRRGFQTALEGFPDLNCDVVESVAEGDKVSVAMQNTGTHTGTFEPQPGQRYAPTGKKVNIPSVSFFTLDGQGKITRELSVMDTGSFFQQLGVKPPEPKPEEAAKP